MNNVTIVSRLQDMKPATARPIARYRKGDRLKKTESGVKTCVMPKSDKGSFVRYTRRGELIVHTDGYAMSSCMYGWHPSFWELDTDAKETT